MDNIFQRCGLILRIIKYSDSNKFTQSNELNKWLQNDNRIFISGNNNLSSCAKIINAFTEHLKNRLTIVNSHLQTC